MQLTEEDPARHHNLAYPMEVGAPNFELVPVTRQKDLMVNAARMHAQQEYDRIMALVAVLQTQANEIKTRLDITDQVCAAEYKFQTYPGQLYWLYRDTIKGGTGLSVLGPDDWSESKPENFEYIVQIQWLGDYTWQEIPGTRLTS
jgi:hypothetical protein